MDLGHLKYDHSFDTILTGFVVDEETIRGECVEGRGEDAGVVESRLLGDHESIGCWVKELQVQQLETGFVDILLSNPGHAAVDA